MRNREKQWAVDSGGSGPTAFDTGKDREIADLKSRLFTAEEESRAARARLEHFLASGSGVVFSCLAEDGYPGLFVSEGVKALLGYETSEFVNPTGLWRDRVHNEDEEELAAMLDCLKDVGHLVHDIRMRHRDGSFKWIRNEMRISRASTGDSGEILCYWVDITDFKSLEEKLLLDAFHDPLTKLPNRALFMDRLGLSCARIQRRKNYGFAVLCVDLDRFKNINDSLGHLKGDRMIDLVGGRMLGCVRFGDTVARLAGDEFAIILDDVKGIEEVETTLQRIGDEFKKPFDLGGGEEVFASVSIGVVLARAECARPEHLLRDADTAMYRAKAAGRAGYAVFDDSMRDQAVSLLRMETDLRRALERKEFVLHYQPIVRLKDGSIRGFEALVRWRHPSLGLVPPKKFIPLAEETGLIAPLGEWVLREACFQMAAWQKRFSMTPPLSISVNLSSRQMVPGIVETVKSILRETGLPPESLFLEITEGTVIESSDGKETFLEEFRRMNVSVLIDDFGTGYSSMNYLNTLSIDGLKIDRSFVKTMTPPGEGREIVGTILNLARALRLDVIAEGVETVEQLTSLRAMNGEYAQGFYFHKPMDPELIENILGEPSPQSLFVSK